MKRAADVLFDLRRRLFGTWTIDDPRPVAEEAPYTFFLPSENELMALAPGDLAQLVFRSHPPSRELNAERMWVMITDAGSGLLHGRLDNTPYDMPQLRPGADIAFDRSQVINIVWASGRAIQPPAPPPRRTYWERCMVDACILAGTHRVDYLYREQSDFWEEGDTDQDSGWRIRADDSGIANDEAAGQSPQYVALGAVLNQDDSWLPLIDSPIGSAFIRDPASGIFVPCD